MILLKFKPKPRYNEDRTKTKFAWIPTATYYIDISKKSTEIIWLEKYVMYERFDKSRDEWRCFKKVRLSQDMLDKLEY